MKKRTNIWIYTLALMGVLLMLTGSCKKKSDNNNPPSNTVTDIDGNVYHTVTIGTQVWMVENLKVTQYRNGDPIQYVTDGTAWTNLTTGAYCDYNNTSGNGATYGKLYNWYAVDDSRNIAPTGWHVPTDAEWTTLTDYLGGESVAGGKLKETGSTHWVSPNIGADNSSGFWALPGGTRDGNNGSFGNLGVHGDWWSATVNGNIAWDRDVFNYDATVSHGSDIKKDGNSVRCVRD